jgi:Cu(I)/Ag(I) efflux system membrane fusion protein
MHKSAFAIFILLLSGLLFSCNRQTEHHTTVIESRKTGISLSDAQIQLANIKVTTVTRGAIGHQLLLSSVLKVDEQSTISISSAIAGRIQKLLFKNTGEIVNKGDALYEFYSESLLALEQEYLSLENSNWNVKGQYGRSIAIENRLLVIGLLPSQIKDIQKNRNVSSVITIYSKARGIVRSIEVTEGQFVNVGQRLMDLADDSKLWVEAQVYPNELQLLKAGMSVDVIIPSAGDLHIQSSINFINPAYEPGRNVTLIRAIINNPVKKLYPGMLALLSVQTQKCKGVVIPASALLIDKQGKLVWVQQEDGSFTSKMVTTGMQTADSVLILSGLKQTEKIVISGAYLLNSEMILKKGTDPMANGIQ